MSAAATQQQVSQDTPLTLPARDPEAARKIEVDEIISDFAAIVTSQSACTGSSSVQLITVPLDAFNPAMKTTTSPEYQRLAKHAEGLGLSVRYEEVYGFKTGQRVLQGMAMTVEPAGTTNGKQ